MLSLSCTYEREGINRDEVSQSETQTAHSGGLPREI